MHKISAALTLEETDPIQGGWDDEAVGDDDNLEEDQDEIDRETAAVIKEPVATSPRDGYERRNIHFMIWFLIALKNTPIFLNQPIVEGRQPFGSEHHSIQTNKSKNPHQQILAI